MKRNLTVIVVFCLAFFGTLAVKEANATPSCETVYEKRVMAWEADGFKKIAANGGEQDGVRFAIEMFGKQLTEDQPQINSVILSTDSLSKLGAESRVLKVETKCVSISLKSQTMYLYLVEGDK